MLEVEHADADLARLETDVAYTSSFAPPVVKQFRILMNLIRNVSKKNSLYQLNKKWRLIVEFSGAEPDEKVLIVGIENHYE